MLGFAYCLIKSCRYAGPAFMKNFYSYQWLLQRLWKNLYFVYCVLNRNSSERISEKDSKIWQCKVMDHYWFDTSLHYLVWKIPYLLRARILVFYLAVLEDYNMSPRVVDIGCIKCLSKCFTCLFLIRICFCFEHFSLLEKIWCCWMLKNMRCILVFCSLMC